MDLWVCLGRYMSSGCPGDLSVCGFAVQSPLLKVNTLVNCLSPGINIQISGLNVFCILPCCVVVVIVIFEHFWYIPVKPSPFSSHPFTGELLYPLIWGLGYIGITLSICLLSILCPSVALSVCLTMSTQYLLNHSAIFYQTWYGGVLSQGDVSCEKIGSLSSMSRSQRELI